MSIRHLSYLAGTLALAGLLTAPALRAQDEEPPEAPQGKAYKLSFKHPPGQVQRFRMDVTSQLEVNREGAPTLPVTQRASYTITEKVTGSRQGTATLSVLVDSMKSSLSVAGQRIDLSSKGGKSNATVNGMVIDTSSADLAGAGLHGLTSKKPVVIRRTTRGGTTVVSAPPGAGTAMGSNNPSPVLVQFPATPLRVGDTWESTQRFRTARTANARRPAAEMLLRCSHTLQALNTRNGKQFALIETSGTTEPAEGAAGDAEQLGFTVTGTARFDVTRGVVISGTYTQEASGTIVIPAGAGGAASQAQQAEVAATTKVLFRDAAAPATPAKRR